MLVNDELYLQIFCKLLEAVVEAGGLEVPVDKLQKKHFCLLSRKINAKSRDEWGIKPATFRDYRYIYKRQKRFSVKENRLDLLCDFVGFSSWIDFRNEHFNHNCIHENNGSVIKLLILPDKRYGEVHNFEGQLSELILSRYEDLKYELDIDNLEILYENQLSDSPSGIKKIQDLAEANQADIVVWPEYLHGNTPMLRIPFHLVDSHAQIVKSKKPSFRKIEGLTQILEGEFLQELDKTLFSLLGKQAFKQNETEKAKTYFSTVLALDIEHKEANYFTGIITQQAKETAQDSINCPVNQTHTTPYTFDSFTLLGKWKESLDVQKELSEMGLSNELSIVHQPTQIDKHLLVLKGDQRVLMTKNLEPLVRSTLIHEDEPVFFLTRQTDMELMSMKDLNVFQVVPSTNEVPIKDAIFTFNNNHLEAKRDPINGNEIAQWFLITTNRSNET